MPNDTRLHIETFRGSFLAQLGAIDWHVDLSLLHRRNAEVLQRLASDKQLMKDLILWAREDPYLWSKCEEDVVEDKIVLWDDMAKNLRIRLRMSTAPQQRLAHSHRFSFTNRVLRGQYVHWIYRPLESFDPLTRLDHIRTVFQHVDRAGDTFTIHHETLHSTPFPEFGTVSLVLRGNPVKERAPVMFKEPRGRAEEIAKLQSDKRDLTVEPEHAQEGDFFWRVGEDRESPERRQERQMRPERIDYWVRELISYDIL